MKLFCLPFAGGSAMYYYDWKKKLAPNFEVIPIELKGRGVRFNEKFDTSFQEIIEDVYSQVISYELDKFMIFGHSMGGMLAFEVFYRLLTNNKTLPKRLFLSGCRPPHLLNISKIIPDENLSNDCYIKEIAQLGGVSQELIENSELIDLIVPIIKNDFSNLCSYCLSNDIILNVPVSILSGVEDEISEAELYEWVMYSSSSMDFQFFSGNHFFITTEQKAIFNYINSFK